jgi:3-oxocholest-4-en-26-oyl-CoA dehydrogenase alpha subunit
VVDFEYPQEIKDFQREVRQFIKDNWDPDVMDPRREGMAQLVDTPKRRAFMKKLGERGWLGMSWPPSTAGWQGRPVRVRAERGARRGRGAVHRQGRRDRRQDPDPARIGELKQEFLPKILDNDVEFAIGYTEPNAGSDLAALELRATRDDERGGWVLNGQKRFTTSAHFAEWYWIIARTDPEAPKHKGATLFLTPMEQEGIQITNMPTIGDERVNEVYLDNVFVPDDYVVGEVNKGFYYVSEALDFERFTLFTVSAYVKRYERFRDWIRTAERDGKPLKDDPLVRAKVAELATRVEIAKMLTLRVIDVASRGGVPNLEAAMFKLWTTTIGQQVAEAFMETERRAGHAQARPVRAPFDGMFEHSWRYTVVDTVGAGTSEVQRNIIARRGLGLPVNNGVK